MQGRGVTSYGLNQPTYGYTTETTEFDDALIQHGIVTREQALIAKGATPEQAHALLEEERQHHEQQKEQAASFSWQNDLKQKKETSRKKDNDAAADGHDNHNINNGDDSSVNDSDDDDDDDEFMQQYREQRMREMKQRADEQNTTSASTSTTTTVFGQVYYISRPEWQSHVNEASMDHWVVVCLTSSDTNRTGRVERAVQELAVAPSDACRQVKFVHITACAAIENWPVEQLPTIFCYRHGKMQHQFVSMPIETNAEDLYQLLQAKQVFD